MARVLIKCPVTGEAITTDFEAEPQSWEQRKLGLNFAWCRACKITHAWTKADAWLEDNGSGGASRPTLPLKAGGNSKIRC